jgi:hypothetical protein
MAYFTFGVANQHHLSYSQMATWRAIVATLSELVTVVARVEALDQANLTLIARAAREAGLIKTSGRGLSAAQMGLTDAANLLIAANVSSVVHEAPGAIIAYRDLEGWEGTFDPYSRAKKRESARKLGAFGAFLEELLESFAKKELSFHSQCIPTGANLRNAVSEDRALVWLTFFKPIPKVTLQIATRNRTGEMRHGAPVYRISQPSLNLVFESAKFRESKGSLIDRSEETTIRTQTIKAVAELLTSSRHPDASQQSHDTSMERK